MVVFKTGAMHPVTTATIKALQCFGLRLIQTVIRCFASASGHPCTAEPFGQVIHTTYERPTSRTIDTRHTPAGPLHEKLVAHAAFGAFTLDQGFSASHIFAVIPTARPIGEPLLFRLSNGCVH